MPVPQWRGEPRDCWAAPTGGGSSCSRARATTATTVARRPTACARAGVRVQVLDAGGRHATVPSCDLVIDAAYGTGFRGEWKPPDVGTTPVLAVDIPSGVDGLTGAVEGAALRAIHTVTFAALKPGLLFPPGRELAGEVELADIGLGVTSFTRLVERKDAADWLPRRDERAHKWSAAVWVVAGSQGMLGAAHLSSRAAQRAGAGMVRLSSPGVDGDEAVPTEVVGRTLPADGWALELMGELDRFDALVVGPGLGRSEAAVTGVRTLIARATVPTLVDGDGLFAFQGDLAALPAAAGADGAHPPRRRVPAPHGHAARARPAGSGPAPGVEVGGRRAAEGTGHRRGRP